MKCLVLLCLVAGAFAVQDCPANQHYESCGTACPVTCYNYLSPPDACELMCVAGCHCDKGYVRTDQGECVKPRQCASVAHCPANQHYDSCGTACPLTCDNYQSPPTFCVLICAAGCHCDEGYVKTDQGQCVRPQQCAAKADVCGENAHFSECGTACPLTCENFQNPPRICPAMCVIGCECDKGFVKAKDGRCVKPEECHGHAEVKSCLGEPETGMCRGYFPMFHYDVQTGSCHQFVYGGCGGNGNKYATEEECMQNCGALGHLKQSSSDVCDLPIEPGRCLAYFPRFAFNKDTGKCEKFIYGGCAGNANNFPDLESCRDTCPDRTAALDRPDCDKKGETGLCRAHIIRYYYDQEEGMCKTFVYGGCGGNRNNFATEFECYNKCGAL